MRRRTVYVILGLLFAATVGGYFLWRSRSSQAAQDDAIRSTVVERGSMMVAVTATGQIEPRARVGLAFETPGRVAEVLVEEGDHVEAGDPLAQLETDQLALQIEQAEAALASAEAQLTELRSGPRPKEIEQAEAAVRAAEAQVSAAEANHEQLANGPTEAEIAAAEAQVAQARASKEIAQDAFDRIDEKGTSKEQANYDLYTAKQELAAAEAALADLLAGASRDELRAAQANVEAAAAQRDASQAQLEQLLAGPTDEETAEAEARVDQARVAVDLAKLSLRNATLRAPFAGLVSQINAMAGELPPTMEPAMVLLDNSAFRSTVSVDELDISGMRAGQSAEVTLEALPEATVEGTVRTIAPAASLGEGVIAYDVLIDLEPTDAPLRADMTANVTVIVDELEDVLKIPTWVVRADRDTGQTYVHRRVGDEIERVDISLGVRAEGVAQVLEGLSEGDEIVRLEDSSPFEFATQ
jgi:HlyD family secretion protein